MGTEDPRKIDYWDFSPRNVECYILVLLFNILYKDLKSPSVILYCDHIPTTSSPYR